MEKTEQGRPVLVAFVPDRLNMEWKQLRDYIMECLGAGVLVLDKSITLETRHFPVLGGVAVCNEAGFLEGPELKREDAVSIPDTQAEEAGPFRAHDLKQSQSPDKPPEVKYAGKAGSDKARIRDRMARYRQANGLGCWATLAGAVRGGTVTEEMLRTMHLGQLSPPIQDWRAVDKALDKLGFETGMGAANG